MEVRRQVRGESKLTAKTPPSALQSLDFLEPRVLLSADLIGMEVPPALEASPGGWAVETDLNVENEQLPRSDPSLILSYLSPAAEQDGIADAHMANRARSGPSETDILLCAEDQLGCAITAPLESQGGTLQFQEEPFCPAAVDQQDTTSETVRLPLEARGPQVPGVVDPSGMSFVDPSIGETGAEKSPSGSHLNGLRNLLMARSRSESQKRTAPTLTSHACVKVKVSP